MLAQSNPFNPCSKKVEACNDGCRQEVEEIRISLLLIPSLNQLFFGFSSTVIAHLFGKHLLFLKTVRTNPEQVPNKTTLIVKNIVISMQMLSSQVKCCQKASNAFKKCVKCVWESRIVGGFYENILQEHFTELGFVLYKNRKDMRPRL